MSKTDKRKTVEDAVKPITITITQRHVEVAKCGDAGACVVAQACLDVWGQVLEAIQVGTHIIKLVFPTKIIRYVTPSPISRALPVFDKTGLWSLPPGQYTLLVPTGCESKGFRGPRAGGWVNYPPKGLRKTNGDGKRDTFTARAIPTRRTMKVNTMCAL